MVVPRTTKSTQDIQEDSQEQDLEWVFSSAYFVCFTTDSRNWRHFCLDVEMLATSTDPVDRNVYPFCG